MGFRFVVVLVLLNISQSIDAQESYKDQIASIRTNTYDQETQIYLFQQLLTNSENENISLDTLALIHYYLSFRYFNINNLAQSKTHAETAIEYYERIDYKDYHHPNIIGKLGDIYYNSNLLDKAIQTYDRLDTFNIHGRGYNALLNAKRISAKIYRRKGDLETEIRVLEFCETFIDSCSINAQSAFYLDLSITYSNNGDSYLIKSKESLRKSVDLNYNKATQSYISPVRREHQIQQEAFIAFKEKNTDQAATLYESALMYSTSHISNIDGPTQARAMANLAFSMLESGLPRRALQWVHRAEDTFGEYGNPFFELEEGLIYNVASDVYLELNDYKLSTQYADKVLSLFDNKNFESSRCKFCLLEALQSKILALYKLDHKNNNQKNKENILQLIQEFDKIADLYINETLFEESAIFIKDKTNDLYPSLIDILGQYKHKELFWKLSEKSKGLLLLDALKTESTVDPQIADSLRINREKQIELSYKLAHEKLTVPQQDSIKIELATNKNIELTIQSELKKKTIRKKFPSIALEEIINQLDSQTLIQYQFGKDYLYCIKIEHSKAEVYQLGNVDSIINLATSYTTYLNTPSNSIEALTNLFTTSYELFAGLIKPLELESHDVILITDGVLNFLPFESLLKSKIEQLNRPKYLLQSYNFQYQNSGSLFATLDAYKNTNTKVSLFNPEYNPAANSNTQLTPLAFSNQEVEAIQQEIYATNKHTKEDFYDAMSLGNSIHFSGHAVIDNIDNSWTYLAFGLGSELENKITLQELYNRKSSSDLVFMSACNTSTGNIMLGEGVSSLSRGFLYTGVKSVVSSLWSVDDQSTSKIASLFYKYLKEGHRKSQALRQAKLSYLEQAADELRHPYYWSSIISIGNDAPIQLRASLKWSSLLAGLGIFILSLFAARWFWKLSHNSV